MSNELITEWWELWEFKKGQVASNIVGDRGFSRVRFQIYLEKQAEFEEFMMQRDNLGQVTASD